jgi:hypothetical protein
MAGTNIRIYCSRKLLDTKYLISALQEHEKFLKISDINNTHTQPAWG